MSRTPDNGWAVKFIDPDKHDFKGRLLAYHKYLRDELHVDKFPTTGDLLIDLLCRPKDETSPGDLGGALTILDGGGRIDRPIDPPGGV